MALKLCPGCHRHARVELSRCPFCGITLATTSSIRSLPIALGIALVACGPSVDAGPQGESDSGATTTGMPMSTTGNTSLGSTTVGPSDTGRDEVGTTSIGAEDDCGDSCCGFYGGCWDVGPAEECNLDLQDCPEHERCAPWDRVGTQDWNATKCVPAAPVPAQLGEPCHAEGSAVSGIDDCDAGLLCFGVDSATLDGACVELCTSPAAACATPGHVCMLQPGDVMGTCLAPCDPLEPGCDELEGCYTFGLGPFGCAPDGSGNAGTYGDECVWATDCEPGLTCLLAPHVPDCQGGACCAPLCDPAQGEPCPDELSGQTCTTISDDPLVGACMLP